MRPAVITAAAVLSAAISGTGAPAGVWTASTETGEHLDLGRQAVRPSGLGLPAEVNRDVPAERPGFEMPFPCGETWQAATRPGHKPLFAVDFNQGSGADDWHRPVVASWGGTVAVKYARKGYGNYVIISHGDGWSTLYAHLDKVQVGDGERVEMGRPIGTVGKSGRQRNPHLHYEQILDGDDVRVVLHGQEVRYYARFDLTSHNCGKPDLAGDDRTSRGAE
ncbi:Peptidase family M23 [Streptosporangium subroseum]|uniref:Peptidase family M23 n=1 Tax=Streptosporangium subroseum TaxID=106412 RepID=A0A239I4A6_9ACTN|nr:M23 family metallopeptidase [Streptosporangium subroseum]SNS88359.1 Peptidase family M23 [Streptosporangium subroseum]